MPAAYPLQLPYRPSIGNPEIEDAWKPIMRAALALGRGHTADPTAAIQMHRASGRVRSHIQKSDETFSITAH